MERSATNWFSSRRLRGPGRDGRVAGGAPPRALGERVQRLRVGEGVAGHVHADLERAQDVQAAAPRAGVRAGHVDAPPRPPLVLLVLRSEAIKQRDARLEVFPQRVFTAFRRRNRQDAAVEKVAVHLRNGSAARCRNDLYAQDTAVRNVDGHDDPFNYVFV